MNDTRRPSRWALALLAMAALAQSGCFSWRDAPPTTLVPAVANGVADAQKTIDLSTDVRISGMFGNYRGADENLTHQFVVELERLGYLVNRVANGKSKTDHARLFVSLTLETSVASDLSLSLCICTLGGVPGYAVHGLHLTGDGIIAGQRERLLADRSSFSSFVWLPLFWGTFLSDSPGQLMDQNVRDAAHRLIASARARGILPTIP